MTRFLLAFSGFVIFVGSGSLWLFFNIRKRKRLLKLLLSLPKSKRFFWYKLRKKGFEVKNVNVTKKICYFVNDEEKNLLLKLDFLLKNKKNKYGGVFISDNASEKELLKTFLIYKFAFKLDGILFYNENERNFLIFEG
jgi:hypothetical protein